MTISMHSLRTEKSTNLYRFTLFTAAEAPVNLQVIKRTPYAMQLTWEYPSAINDIVKEFVIHVKLLSSQLRRQGGKKTILKYQFKISPSITYSYEVSES